MRLWQSSGITAPISASTVIVPVSTDEQVRQLLEFLQRQAGKSLVYGTTATVGLLAWPLLRCTGIAAPVRRWLGSDDAQPRWGDAELAVVMLQMVGRHAEEVACLVTPDRLAELVMKPPV